MTFKTQILFALIRIRISKWLFANKPHKLQQKRWKKMQQNLLKSPFYKEKVLEKIPLENYPIMDKAKFMANFDEINTHGISLQEAMDLASKAEHLRNFSPTIKGITVGLSSGTSGNRSIFMASQKERAYWVACVLDRVIGVSTKKTSIAFFLRANSNLYSSVKSKRIHFEFFDILKKLQLYIPQLNNLQPTILVAQPSVLLELASFIENGSLSITPLKVISVAEVLEPEDAEYLQSIFRQKIHQVYQCTEGMLATTCQYGHLHFNEDFLIIEKKYIDAEKKRFHPIITDLFRTTQPIIRYELNDILHEKSACACGSKFQVIQKIEGRSDDVLSFTSYQNKQIKVYPDFIRQEIIGAHALITNYTVVQKNESLLELFIGESAYYELAKNKLQMFLKAQGVYEVQIQRAFKKNYSQGNKFRRIQNEWTKS